MRAQYNMTANQISDLMTSMSITEHSMKEVAYGMSEVSGIIGGAARINNYPKSNILAEMGVGRDIMANSAIGGAAG